MNSDEMFKFINDVNYCIGIPLTKCPIYNFCKANGGICNENCIVNNQKKIKGKENCYYRRFFEQHGLFDTKID